MMNAEASAHGNQKDFYNTYLHPDHSPHSLNPSRSHSPSIHEILEMNGMNIQQNSPGVNMDVLDNLMASASSGAGGPSSMPVPSGSGSQPTQQMLVEHQMRLNQLQQLYQLQTQIFQQQIEILSGQSSFGGTLPMSMMVDPNRPRDQQQYLPTPNASGELPPQPSPDFVPHMLLQSGSPAQSTPQSQAFNQHNTFLSNHHMQSHMPNQHLQHGQHGGIPAAPHSAPANIVFQNIHGHLGGGAGSNMNSPYGMLPSPAELDIEEMSPLTSPWLGAYNSASGSSAAATSGNQQAGLGDHNILPSGASSTLKRRTRTSSPGSDDTATSRGRTARKRQAALPRLPPPTVQSSTKKSTNSLRGGTKSANSTPVFPPTHGSGPLGGNRPNTRRNTAGTSGDVPGDSPSPVDLSMPPPATPAPLNSVEFLINNTQASGSVRNDQHPEGTEQPLLPVTPSSIMNLGRLGTHSSLAPPAQKSTRKGSTRPRSATSAASMSGDRTPLVSPALKPIRPASNVSGLQGSMSPSGPSMTSMQGQQPPLQVRKTSHKAAEQKRRDSLKTSFDDLRVLLPPIPLPSEEGFPDEPILPGAMPPRGPPKGNADGPNRGVSKLQLLRCGNDYIRRLKGRVERRDVEIDRLRKEIERLRIAVGTHDEMEEADPIDLTADLDAVEATLGPLGRSSTGMGDDDGDDDGE